MSEYSNRSVTPSSPPVHKPQLHTVAVGEQLESDYSIQELPGCSNLSIGHQNCSNCQSLLACIEMLEAENSALKIKTNGKSYL